MTTPICAQPGPYLMRYAEVGEQIELTVLRDGEARSVAVTLDARFEVPVEPQARTLRPAPDGSPRAAARLRGRQLALCVGGGRHPREGLQFRHTFQKFPPALGAIQSFMSDQ